MKAAAVGQESKRLRLFLQEAVGGIVFVVLLVVFSLLSGGRLLSAYNLKNIVDQSMGILAGGLGMLFVISTGSTDISIAGTAAVSATLGCIASQAAGGWAMLPVTLLVALGIGLFNGVLVSRLHVSSFMCTLAMLIALKGFMLFLIDGKSIKAPVFLRKCGQFSVKLAVLLVLIGVLWYVFEFTRLGHYCKAMGENETCVEYVGIGVRAVRTAAFAISGLMAGFLGLFLMAKQGGPSNTFSNFMEMKVMMAIFLGGVPTSGGFGARMYKLIIGAMTTSVIINGLTVCQISTAYTQMIQGLCLIAVLWMAKQLSDRARGVR